MLIVKSCTYVIMVIVDIDPSVNNFIQNPQMYHLEQKDGVIRAVGGALDHRIQAAALNEIKNLARDGDSLAKRTIEVIHSQQLNPSNLSLPKRAIHSCFSSINSTTSSLEIILNEWCDEAIGTDEYPKRIEALKRIQNCVSGRSETLDLSALSLTSLPDCFAYLSQLKTLNLRNNQIREIPESLGFLSQLTVLNLEYNQIRVIPEFLGFLSQLTFLSLVRNQISVIPDSLGILSKLGTLGLSHNEIREVPESLGNLSELTYLGLSHNEIREIPEFLGNLSKLTYLHLSHNEIREIPDFIGHLSKLTYLDLSHNEIREIPDFIGHLSKLTHLDLEHNQIRVIPEFLGNLSKLTDLLLSYNPIAALPIELARLRGIIDVHNCLLTLQSVQAFQAAIRQAREEDPRLGPEFQHSIYDAATREAGQHATLEEMVSQWNTWYNEAFPAKASTGNYQTILEHPKQDLLNLFLAKLQHTEDFKNPNTKNNVILRVHNFLEGAVHNEEFREKLFLIIEDALSSCGDRVTLCFNQIELQWQLLCNTKNLTDEKLIRVILGARRLDLLDKEARKLINQLHLGDQIEVFLYLQVKLREALELPITTEGMLYPDMSGVSSKKLEEVKQTVLRQSTSPEDVVTILSESDDIWVERLKSRFPEDFEAINAEFLEKMEAYEDPSKVSLTSEEYNRRINDLNQQHKKATLDLVKRLTANRLVAG